MNLSKTNLNLNFNSCKAHEIFLGGAVVPRRVALHASGRVPITLVTHAMWQLIDACVSDVGEMLPTEDLHHLSAFAIKFEFDKWFKKSRYDAPASRAS